MNTKKMLVNALRALMEEKPLEKITIKAIVTEAEVSKATFYRHFYDKFDLVNYYFCNYFNQLFTFNVYERGQGELRAVDALYFMKENIGYFKKAFMQEGTNSLTEYQYKYYYDIYHKNTLEIKGKITDEDLVAIKFYCSGVAFIVRDWILNGCILSPEKMAHLIHVFLPEQIPFHY